MKLWHILALLAAVGAGVWYFVIRPRAEKPDTTGKKAGLEPKRIKKSTVRGEEGGETRAAAEAAIGLQPNKSVVPQQRGRGMGGAAYMRLLDVTQPQGLMSSLQSSARTRPFEKVPRGNVAGAKYRSELADAGNQVTQVPESDINAGGKIPPVGPDL